MLNDRLGNPARRIVLKNGRIIDPARSFDQIADILLAEGKILRIEETIAADAAEVYDCSGLWITPGLIDVHCHLREPGYENKETILSGTQAAAHGGFTTLVSMANVNPVPHNVDVYEQIQQKIRETAVVRVFQAASVTRDLQGKELTDMASLAALGVKVFSDDGFYIERASVLYKALKLAKKLNVIVSLHEEDASLKAYWPTAYHPVNESAAISRDLEVLRYCGGRMHIQHVSTARSVELIRQAKAEGLEVTAEVCPHHLILTLDTVPWKGTYAKMAPPLRMPEDVEALIQGLDDGTIDFIATDHAPHTEEDKNKAFDLAANGIIGLETAMPILLTKLVYERGYTPAWLFERMSSKPAQIFRLPGGSILEGMPGDLCIIDPECKWEINDNDFVSKGHNSPFIGMEVKGKVAGTLVNGNLVYEGAMPARRIQ
ncbi:dihydroorotase [Sporomusa aerivorans]|uniref:dihydroorotase n=1 Tax=Sporomusa aerivorans TaxID=204936 RepID=UPI00352A0D72